MITFWGITNFWEVTFLLRMIISWAETTCSTRNICVKGTSIEGTGIRVTYIKGTYIGDTSTCANNIYIRDIRNIGTCIRSTCVNSISAIKHSGIYSQFFQNLEVGNTRLKIWVVADYIYI